MHEWACWGNKIDRQCLKITNWCLEQRPELTQIVSFLKCMYTTTAQPKSSEEQKKSNLRKNKKNVCATRVLLKRLGRFTCQYDMLGACVRVNGKQVVGQRDEHECGLRCVDRVNARISKM